MYESKNRQLYSVDDVDQIGADEVRRINHENLNMRLTELLATLNCDKVYTYAKDCVIKDADNRAYLDFIGAYGAMNLGNNHDCVTEAVVKVRDKLNLAYIGFNPYEAALSHNLVELTNRELQRVFYCNSGSEAVESALKMARAATGESRIIYCKNSYHGKSLGALTVTGQTSYKDKFEPLIPDMDEIPFGDEAALEKELYKGCAAFIVEPIQGEGGIKVPPEGYFLKVRKLCTKYHALLILDEVQTGLGRTGSFFAYEYEKIVPDILCLAKSLGGGVMPIGACLARNWIYQKAYGELSTCMLHSSTFGGNTYACAAALAAIEVLTGEELAKQAEEKGKFLLKGLNAIKEKCSSIREVRGRGLLIGVEFDETAQPPAASGLSFGMYIASALIRKYRIITSYSNNNNNLVRLEPPLTITYEQMESLLLALEDLLIKENRKERAYG